MNRQPDSSGLYGRKWPPVLLALLLASSMAQARPAGAQAEIVVTSQSATIQQREGLAEYVGNAELRQGNRHLKAGRIVIQLVNDQPVRVEASGEPVTLTEGPDMEASAARLVYDLGAGRIWLYEQARIRHQGRLFEGAELEYRLDTRQVNASGGSGDGRVKLVIPAEPPEQEVRPE